MKILIIEDEQHAAESLEELILELRPQVIILASLSSVEDSIDWLSSHPSPDLIFSDIQLSDGNSFEIFREIDPGCPVIFTTAFNEYALEAFKVNSIDYLLKPIKKREVGKAIKKFEDLYQHQVVEELNNLKKLLANTEATSTQTLKKSRFLAKSGQTLVSIPSKDVAYFQAEDGVVFLYDFKGKRYIVNQTLEELTEDTDSNSFFRVNRQYLVHIDSVKEAHSYFKGRLKLELNPAGHDDIIISSNKSNLFKKWLDQ
ncbi:LytR/AlgR family response regulator transcription factor [Psychroflexus sediminis]|uniref:Two component transcriptional regulator, LytTR family n=1 Tax=Psychroflexus sediminis TaxID=470826 RepID=A0A1G7W7F2_9FLAO|nr:LytTR family DNA-binding domain-containing protein [Psychroflexus sediminis]SDG67882.1 two component transcriptional regulator, LytTR family [Psychroflexus sediminis]